MAIGAIESVDERILIRLPGLDRPQFNPALRKTGDAVIGIDPTSGIGRLQNEHNLRFGGVRPGHGNLPAWDRYSAGKLSLLSVAGYEARDAHLTPGFLREAANRGRLFHIREDIAE